MLSLGVPVFLTVVGLIAINFSTNSYPPSKEQTAASDIKTIDQMISLHKDMHGVYPHTLDLIDPTIISSASKNYLIDPWGVEYSYELVSDGYVVESIGLKNSGN